MIERRAAEDRGDGAVNSAPHAVARASLSMFLRKLRSRAAPLLRAMPPGSRGRRTRLAALALALAGAAAAVGGLTFLSRPPRFDYFPLDAGRSWVYGTRVTVQGADPQTFKTVALNLGRETVDGASATPRLYHDGRVLYYRQDGDGIRTVAFHEPGQPPQPAANGQYVLKRPLAPGTKWRAPGHTFLLTQRLLYNKVVEIAIPLEIDYAIESANETVEVRAGRFRHCLKVRGSAKSSVYALDSTRRLAVSVETEDWFAPGLGLVKSVRSEMAGAERTGNARMVMELERFE